VLDDATFRKTTEKRSPAVAREAYVTNILSCLHHSDLITLQAKLLDRSVHPSQRSTTNATRKVVGLVLLRHESTEKDPHDLSFTAEADVPEDDDTLVKIPIGSVVEVTGICFTQGGEDKKAHNVQVLLADPNNVRIVEAPSWFTPQRMLIGSSILLAVLLVALSWSVTVSKKNLVLKESIRDKEKAQHELQEAHDQLEERVKERTAQLKFQITARKESEVQYKAILKERTRLAQELHDTLEQSLTGIALQLDTSAKLFEAKPQNANHHLEMARNLVAQSQVDVRRSVWDLRSRALEQFDLAGALLTSGQQLVDGTNIHFDVAAKGRVRPLPDTVEENLLRIAQEALTNVIKHSKATTATIELDYGPQTVALQIKDNGCGFAQNNAVGPSQGHFGLLGISERAKRLNAELEVSSEPGQGTTVRVRVPVDQDFQSPKTAASEEAIA
jgi:signal transduction histidine kinase